MLDALSSLWFMAHFTLQRASNKRPCCWRGVNATLFNVAAGPQTCWLWHFVWFCTSQFAIWLVFSSVFFCLCVCMCGWRRTEKRHNFPQREICHWRLRLTRSHLIRFVGLITGRNLPTRRDAFLVISPCVGHDGRPCAFLPPFPAAAPPRSRKLFGPQWERQGGRADALLGEAHNTFSLFCFFWLSDKKDEESGRRAISGDKFPK